MGNAREEKLECKERGGIWERKGQGKCKGSTRKGLGKSREGEREGKGEEKGKGNEMAMRRV